jgi:hypothetical protein
VTTQVPMTGLLVSHNEGHLIADRLRELDFCDELIVVDVASSDDTAEVASAGGARVVSHAYARIAELVHPNVVDEAQNDLVVLPDPDESIPPALAAQLVRAFQDLEQDVGLIMVPRIYYFRGKPLRGTIWGGTSGKRLVARRSGVRFTGAVHEGVHLRPGFRALGIDYDGTNAMHHLWASGYRDFIRKHVRFIKIEGQARALMGEITGYRALFGTPWKSFRECFVNQQGYRDGLRGLILSILYAFYRTASDVALIRELRRSNGRR